MPASPTNVHDLAQLLKVIADETRLKILGALAERPLTGKELAERFSLTPPTISHHLRKLADAGIVSAEHDAQRHWYRLNAEILRTSRQVPVGELPTPSPTPVAGDSHDEADYRAKVIRDFFEGERLKEIPAQRKKRVIVLQYVLQRFDPGRTYAEREVNDLLRPSHEDVATLRRELVDYGFLERERGIYQVSRAGPARSCHVRQEITGSERIWLQSLLDEITAASTSEVHTRSQIEG